MKKKIAFIMAVLVAAVVASSVAATGPVNAGNGTTIGDNLRP